MKSIWRIGLVACLSYVLPLMASPLLAEDELDEDAITMISMWLADSDIDTQKLAFREIADQGPDTSAPGTAATKRFVEMIPDLSPALQVQMIEALGDRGDVTALPAVLKSLESEEEAMRVTSIKALKTLGSEAEVPGLIEKSIAGTDLEKSAATGALIGMKAEGINPAIQAVLSDAKTEGDVRVQLIDVLSNRNAKESVPLMLQQAEDEDAAVRKAAFKALRVMADENHTAALVELLKKSPEDERRMGEYALLSVCSRRGELCAEAVAAGMEQADSASRVVLLRILARAGGPKTLETIVGRLEDMDEDDVVRYEAVRMLSRISDPGAIPHLRKLAALDDLRHRILAVRGLVRHARPGEDKPADEELLHFLLSLNNLRVDEKRLVLGLLGGIGTSEALILTSSFLEDSEVVDEAEKTVLLIAKKIAKEIKEKEEKEKSDAEEGDG